MMLDTSHSFLKYWRSGQRRHFRARAFSRYAAQADIFQHLRRAPRPAFETFSTCRLISAFADVFI